MRKTIVAWLGVLGMILMVTVLAGCQTPPAPGFPEDGVATTSGGGKADGSVAPGDIDILQVGDLVNITYKFIGTALLDPHQERIKDDGTITPPNVGAVKAAGKRVGELQKELQTLYDKFYNHITVTVNSGDRYFYVDGEVMQRGAKLYLGGTDLVKAIAAGGGFTEFANQKKVRIIRPNGKSQTVNYKKAINDPSENLPVYPGDKVWVPRRIL